MLHCDIELHRFTLSMNLQRYLVAGKGARGQEISKVKLLIKRIEVVTILIKIEVANGGENIAFLQAGLLHRAPRFDPPHVNATAICRFASVFTQLRVACWKI